VLDWLRCPECGWTTLLAEQGVSVGEELVSGALECPACGSFYPIEDGIPFLLPVAARDALAHRASNARPADFVGYRTEATRAVARLLAKLGQSAAVTLDLGSGRAPYLQLFSGDVICIDIFPQFLRDLPTTVDNRIRVHRICASATHVPIRLGAADLVFASELIEHLEPRDARRALQEWPRLASQWCVIDTPNGHEGDWLTRVRHTIYRTRTLTASEHPDLPELDHHSTFSPADFRAAGYECHGCIGWVSRKRFRLRRLWDLYDAIAWRFPALAGTLIAVSPGREPPIKRVS